MQALYLLAVDPVAESTADPNSYGFRKDRSTADAISQCFIALGKKQSPRWILEGDIKACFDKISHDWMLANIPMDKAILRKWLKAGFIDENTRAGLTSGIRVESHGSATLKSRSHPVALYSVPPGQ